jgi:hypothetical protein
MEFLQNPSDGSRGRREKVVYSLRTVPSLLTDLSEPYTVYSSAFSVKSREQKLRYRQKGLSFPK